MDLNQWISQTLQIQSIPSPTFDEGSRGQYLKSQFSALGLEQVAMDELGNVYGQIPGPGGPPLVISAHLDTVFGPSENHPAQRLPGRLAGPGIGDNAVSLAALLELAADLRPEQIGAPIWLVGNVGEEGLGNLRGMMEVVTRFGGAPCAYLVLEGMALGQIYHRALPVIRLSLAISTAGGHSWIHAGRPSAIHVLVQLAHRLLAEPLPAAPRTSLNLGHIQGGSTINTIAQQAVMEIDIRSESEQVANQLAQRIQSLADETHRELIGCQVREIGRRPGGALPASHPLVEAALASLQEAGIAQPSLAIGSTDASAPLSRGYPAICIGLTRGGEAHSQREYIEIAPMAVGYRALTSLITRLTPGEAGRSGKQGPQAS
jgi:tripeptide aminopeptidase